MELTKVEIKFSLQAKVAKAQVTRYPILLRDFHKASFFSFKTLVAQAIRFKSESTSSAILPALQAMLMSPSERTATQARIVSFLLLLVVPTAAGLARYSRLGQQPPEINSMSKRRVGISSGLRDSTFVYAVAPPFPFTRNRERTRDSKRILRLGAILSRLSL